MSRRHGCRVLMLVVRHASRPFPARIEDDKLLVWGRGSGGRLLQVNLIFSPEDIIYVIMRVRLRNVRSGESRGLRR